MEFLTDKNETISIGYELHLHKTVRGARDSLGGVAGMGPPIEPDEEFYHIEVKQVEVFGIDIIDEIEVDDFYTSEDGLDGVWDSARDWGISELKTAEQL